MSDTAKIVAAAVGGYILGRKKKLKLALGLGLYLGAKKLDIKPQMLAQGLLKEVSSLPLVGELRNQSREQLLDVGKAAAGNLAGKWAGSLADSLNERTESLRSGAGKGAADTVTGGSERSEDGDGAREDDEDTGAPSSEKDSEGASPDKGGRKAKVRKTAPGRAAAGAAGKAGSGTRKAAQRKRPARKGGEEDGDGRG
ncbi:MULTISPECIES: hypothetical protein [Nocardiopsidaceae]|uniref:Histone protein n=1 Tax=Streptomonospora nanhaiensis TaxID=1323731 RepID=A0ABY6YR82_9ACTN|nr:hypothetical protein [Streptomonospora nanhaiensis]WAE74763.1 hypothetical protein OUQ99_06545 [Streptomonospora nanhaiensis]